MPNSYNATKKATLELFKQIYLSSAKLVRRDAEEGKQFEYIKKNDASFDFEKMWQDIVKLQPLAKPVPTDGEKKLTLLLW